MFDTLKGPEFATSIGLLIYGTGGFTPYEMDSQRKLRYKDETIEPSKNPTNFEEEEQETTLKDDLEIGSRSDDFTINDLVGGDSRDSGLQKLWNKITQLF